MAARGRPPKSGPGVVYDRGGVKVTAIPVPHGDWQAFAHRFDLPGRSMTFSGDTAPSPALVKAARGTDILVHEVYNGKRIAPEARPGGEFWPGASRAPSTRQTQSSPASRRRSSRACSC
ncbi:MAG: hypothetical protein MZV64_30685 [Ignavibacteriales bacterium]|nr:hypothetical protein [Ignavibacteriales bacterium]